ncbi:GH17825 [Drosophila grimshawi]|uniref:GH17825 n=1 Tax=Drosophila grimshawi TaxID=7222 RepID=B4JWV4_DROGR|nr:GH17825 [Drosophila grimshawi]
MPQMVSTTKPKLIMSNAETEPHPSMVYHLITDNRPLAMGHNYYIKPGQLVGSFSLESGTLNVKHEDTMRPISSKLNILFVATPNEVEDTSSIQNELNE